MGEWRVWMESSRDTEQKDQGLIALVIAFVVDFLVLLIWGAIDLEPCFTPDWVLDIGSQN